MKKLVASGITLLSVLTLVACSGNQTAKPKASSEKSSSKVEKSSSSKKTSSSKKKSFSSKKFELTDDTSSSSISLLQALALKQQLQKLFW